MAPLLGKDEPPSGQPGRNNALAVYSLKSSEQGLYGASNPGDDPAGWYAADIAVDLENRRLMMANITGTDCRSSA